MGADARALDAHRAHDGLVCAHGLVPVTVEGAGEPYDAEGRPVYLGDGFGVVLDDGLVVPLDHRDAAWAMAGLLAELDPPATPEGVRP